MKSCTTNDGGCWSCNRRTITTTSTTGSSATTTAAMKLFMILSIVFSIVSFVAYESMFQSMDQRLLTIEATVLRSSDLRLRHNHQAHTTTTTVSSSSNTISSITTTTTTTAPNVPYEICFVTSVFTSNIGHADKVQNVTNHVMDNPTFGYFAYTNNPKLAMPGWTQIVQHYPQYQRMITKSRYPKFMAWKRYEEDSNNNETTNSSTQVNTQDICQVVFYMDGITIPRSNGNVRNKFRKLAKQILQSEYGVAQYKHKVGGSPFDEFQRILWSKKDTPDNVLASIEWLKQQPDFTPNCTLYENRIFGYNPRNLKFQQAASFFWNHYSLEVDSWRDQPLWCYTLHKFNIQPVPLDGIIDDLFTTKLSNMGHGGHHYW